RGFRRFLRVEGARAQRPLELHPAGRRAAVIDMRRRAEEAVAPDLALIGSFRQVGMGLARGPALDARELDPVLTAHAVVSFRTPRRIWSSSIDSNSALK